MALVSAAVRSPSLRDIEKDVTRTLPEHPYFLRYCLCVPVPAPLHLLLTSTCISTSICTFKTDTDAQ